MGEGNVGGSSDGTRLLSEESSATVASSTSISSAFYKVVRMIYSFVALICSSAEDSTGCAPSPSDPAHATSEYHSTRIQSMVESRSEFATPLEAEIDASRVHWSEVHVENGGRGSTEANLEVYRSLQEQHGGPDGFFRDWDDHRHALGEKIAEGAQGEIFLMRLLRPANDAYDHGPVVLKVFKKGWSLEDLEQQWPPGMLLKTVTSGKPYYVSGGGSDVMGGVIAEMGGVSVVMGGLMLKDSRFGFLMLRCWGDLRKVFDLRMQHNGNQAPPFSDETALKIMHAIASGMRGLHQDNIVHRDLKASNLLVLPSTWIVEIVNKTSNRIEDFNPTNDDNFRIFIGDFECSVGVVGTRLWRAPEILHGLKHDCVEPSLFTKKCDVYSYAMTCYEILTGKIPLENVAANDYDAILLQSARPKLPSGLEPWIQSLLEVCWHHDPSKRPSFEEVVTEFEGRNIGQQSLRFRW